VVRKGENFVLMWPPVYLYMLYKISRWKPPITKAGTTPSRGIVSPNQKETDEANIILLRLWYYVLQEKTEVVSLGDLIPPLRRVAPLWIDGKIVVPSLEEFLRTPLHRSDIQLTATTVKNIDPEKWLHNTPYLLNYEKTPGGDTLLVLKLASENLPNELLRRLPENMRVTRGMESQFGSISPANVDKLCLVLQNKQHVPDHLQEKAADNVPDEYQKVAGIIETMPFLLLVMSDAKSTTKAASAENKLVAFLGAKELEELYGDWLWGLRERCYSFGREYAIEPYGTSLPILYINLLLTEGGK